MKKKIFLVLVIIAGSSFAYNKFNSNKNDLKEKINLVTVTLGNIEEVVTAQGKLEPKEYVDVGTQVSGILNKLYVEVGDYVKAGDIIAKIDPRIYETNVLASKARLKSLNSQIAEQNANISLIESRYKRSEKLLETKNISQEAFEQIIAEKAVAYAKLNSIKAQIEEADSNLSANLTNLEYTKIYAPMSGIIVLENSKEGQTLNASQTAPVIVQIADLDTMTVKAQVAEADISRISENMEVYFTTLGMQNRKWYGKVRQILPSPEIINEVVLYNVLIDVDNKDRLLMTGMSSQVFFVIGKAENVPLVPTEVLTNRLPEKDVEEAMAYRVNLFEKGSQVEKIIHIGLMSRSLAEVIDGLNVGDNVVSGTSSVANNKKDGGNRPPRFGGPRL